MSGFDVAVVGRVSRAFDEQSKTHLVVNVLPSALRRSAASDDHRKRLSFEQWTKVVWIAEVEVSKEIESKFNQVGYACRLLHRNASSIDRFFRDDRADLRNTSRHANLRGLLVVMTGRRTQRCVAPLLDDDAGLMSHFF
jgi:hypothetical protein